MVLGVLPADPPLGEGSALPGASARSVSTVSVARAELVVLEGLIVTPSGRVKGRIVPAGWGRLLKVGGW